MIILFDYSIKILCNQNYRNVYKYQRPLPVLNSPKNKVRLDTNIQVAITIIKSYKNIHTAYYMYLLLIFCDTCSNYQPPNYFPIISYLFNTKRDKNLVHYWAFLFTLHITESIDYDRILWWIRSYEDLLWSSQDQIF